jgi:hypothetical protein
MTGFEAEFAKDNKKGQQRRPFICYGDWPI